MSDLMLPLKKISEDKLAISEPPPHWFGNKANEVGNANWTNANWLKSRFHFSFAEYSNPRNQNFGVLRVLNDDLVQPDRGFGEHPHRDVEICTYIVEGSLTHADSMGTQETLERGAIQFMTAGTGVRHSEHNLDKEKPLRFIQMWITTRKTGLRPNYGSTPGSYEDRHNKWSHLVSDVDSSSDTPIQINQDANIYVAEIDAGETLTFEVLEGRQVYLLCMEGSCQVVDSNSTESIARHDSAEVFGPNSLSITTPLEESATGHFLICEMAFTGKGRGDV